MQNNISNNSAYAYLITFRTYGTWLHGDDRTSVDPKNNIFGQERIPPHKIRQEKMEALQALETVILDEQQKEVVLKTILKVCEYCGWRLFAVHVRTNHVHLVIEGEHTPEFMMTKLKAYASRKLNELNPEDKRIKYWSRHGSTRYIFAPEWIFFAVQYVVEGQGEKMAWYCEAKYLKLLEENAC